jgi:hypothetical protein
MKLVTYVVIAKIFTALTILSVLCGAFAAVSGNIELFIYGLCGIIVFASLTTKFIKKCLALSENETRTTERQ